MRFIKSGLVIVWAGLTAVPGIYGADTNGQRPFEWPIVTPESQGLSSSKLDALKNDLAVRKTKAFLVIRHDRIVCEWYAPGHGSTQKHGTASLAKALVAGLSLGVALSDGRLALDDPAAKYIPQWRDDPRKSKITLRQLGSHTSGIEDAEADNLPHNQLTGWKGDFWKQPAPPHDPFTLARDAAPVVFEPGAKMQYSNPGIALLTYCVTAALRDAPQKDIRSLLRDRIMRPIGVPDNEWSAGYEKTFTVDGLPLVGSWGGGSYTARAVARVGRLMLRKGRWNGPPLISESAVRDITNDAGTPGNGGIGWWSNNSGRYPGLPKDAFWGAGAGHQVLLVIPSLNLIAVRNGDLLDAAADFDRGLDQYLFTPLLNVLLDQPTTNAANTPAIAPFPPSPVILSIEWAPKETIRRAAQGSDRFPMTWADDDSQYTAWGDGNGFGNIERKLSLGFARVNGPVEDFVAEDIRSATGEDIGDGRSGYKASGLLSVEGTLYLWVSNADKKGRESRLAWSSDHARTWNWADWHFAEFGYISLLNFGRDYAGARDGFVYAVASDQASAYVPADRFILMRVPKERLRERDAYEFWARLGADGRPVWTRDIGQRGAMFSNPGACLRQQMTYCAPLHRYLWWQQLPNDHRPDDLGDTRFAGGFAIYDAPEPWGPWTTACFTPNWDTGPGETASFPAKWMSADGRKLWLAFSGEDSFSVREATLLLAEAKDNSRPRIGSGLQPVGLRCDYQEDPLSIDTARPSLSWMFEPGTRGQRQTAYRLLVASSQERLDKLQGDLWDTGTVPSSAQNQIEYAGQPLAANQRCFWKIKVWDQAGRAGPWSRAAGWTMGLLSPADWKAKWIRADDQPAAARPASLRTKSENDAASPAAGLPLFRRSIEVSKPLRRAIVHVSGLGQYDLFLDGRKVGDHFLDPAWSVYEKTVYYNTYDLTAFLEPGTHVFGVMLGKGFYNTAGDRRVHGVQANRPLKLILQAHLLFADGSEQVIVTDASWRTAPGPITHSAILGGEDYDARLRPSGWDRPGFDDSAWTPARECDGPGGVLAAAAAPPMKSQQVFPPARIGEPAPGILVYDFGQNASAVPRLRVRGRAGQVIKLVPAEQRHGMSPRRNNGTGLVNQAGVGAPNYFQYTLRGGAEETWTPQFSYTGFQYLQVEGGVPRGRPNPAGKPVIEELVSAHVRNDSLGAGHFACSNPLFNQIDRLVDWAVRANLGHVLTDCPHREKLGWLEVSYLMGPSIAGRYDIARFYRKIARDCADSQKTDGLVPTVAPAYPAFAGGFAYTPEWGAAAVVLPWQIYQWYGDRTVLSERYATMKGFVDYMRNTSTNLVPRPGLGDWYDYDGKTLGPSQFTPPELSAMATFYRCTQIVAQTAGLLDRPDDQRLYGELADRIARAFNDRFFDGTAEYRNHGSPQTANSMALALGLVPAGHESATLDRIVQDIQQRNNQQTAGDIGHWYLLQALAQYGRSDVIYRLTTRTNLGSYGYIVRNGWTAMPEAWDADTGASMNHCMLGHIQEWFLNDVAGIRPDSAAPGFRQVIFAPQIGGDLEWARGCYDSIRGRIVSDWKRNGSRFTLNVTVPPNTTGTVYLPASDLRSVREHGRPLEQAPGVRLCREESGVVVLEIASGSYRFQASIADPHPRYGLPGRKVPN